MKNQRKSRSKSSGDAQDDDYLPSLLPQRVSKPYQKCGWILFLLLMALFLVGCSTLIALRYKARADPDISIDVQKEKEMKFPSTLIICPDSSGMISWHFFELVSHYNAKVNKSLLNAQVFNFENVDMDCLKISVDAQVLQSEKSSALEFALVWSGKLSAYSDLLISFDEDFRSTSYMAAGIYNSSRGVSNNIDLSLERYRYLPSSHTPSKDRWISSTATTDYFYYTVSENSTRITCDNSANLKYTEECTTQMQECHGDLRPFKETKCAMMTVFFIALNSDLVVVFEEVDPVDWKDIIASIGGYWVYVGAGFSLFFVVKKGSLELIPISGIRNLFGKCFNVFKNCFTVHHEKNEDQNDPKSSLRLSHLKKPLIDA